MVYNKLHKTLENNHDEDFVGEKQSIFDVTRKSHQFIPNFSHNHSTNIVYIDDKFWKYLSFFLLFLLVFLFLFWYLYPHVIKTYIPEESLGNNNFVVNYDEDTNTWTDPPQCKPDGNNEITLIRELTQIQNIGKKFLENIDNSNTLDDKFLEYKAQIQSTTNIELLKNLSDSDEGITEIVTKLEAIIGKDASYLSNLESLGVEINDTDMSIVIPKNSEFPITRTKTYYTRKEFQTKMNFRIFAGEDEKTVNNTYLGLYVIENLKPISEIGARVDVTINVDQNGKISFLARDILTPTNTVGGYLDTEVDIFTRGNDSTEEIKNKFIDLNTKIDSVLSKAQSQVNILNEADLIEVLWVIDGDTVVINYNNIPTSVRLIGIDAPENSKYRYGFIEEFGEESSEYLKSLILNGEIHIEFDETQGFTDTYGRPLVYLFIDDKNINQLMIEAGLAKEYTYDIEYKYSTDFKNAEIEAQKNRLGIWQ